MALLFSNLCTGKSSSSCSSSAPVAPSSASSSSTSSSTSSNSSSSSAPEAPIGPSVPACTSEKDYRLYLGDTDKDGSIFVCNSCCSCLSKKAPEPPKNSIYFTDLGGDVPDCLKDLTLPEQLLICPIIVKAYVLKLVSHGSPQSAQRAIKGNTIAFMQDVQEVITQLPCLNSLDEYLKVCWIGDPTCAIPIQRIKKLLTVRREKVRLALEWLCINHKGFIELGITINKDTLLQLPEDDIPMSIIENISRSGDVEAASAESSSYVPQQAEPDADQAQVDIPIERSGVIDVDTTQMSNADLFSAAFRNLNLKPDPRLTDNSIIKARSGSQPVGAYNNPHFWSLAFPALFPYGIGGCDDKRPPFHTWIDHLLNLRDDRFRLHYSFMFVAFSINQVREVCKCTRFCVSRENANKTPLEISSETLKKTYEEVKKAKSQNPNIVDPEVRGLMNQLKAIGSNVTGSDFQRRCSFAHVDFYIIFSVDNQQFFCFFFVDCQQLMCTHA